MICRLARVRAADARLPRGQPRSRQQLERVEPLVLELAPEGIQPRHVDAAQQPALEDVEAASASAAAAAGVAGAERGAAALDASGRRLHVELRVGGKREPELAPAAQEVGADAAPHAREQRAERARRVAGRAARPQRVDQLVARDRAVVVEREVGQQDAAEPAGQLALAAPAGDVEPHLATQLDADLTQVPGGHHHRTTISRPRARR